MKPRWWFYLLKVWLFSTWIVLLFVMVDNIDAILRAFLKILQYSQETPVLESLFNELAGLQACKFIKKKLQHRCFPVNIAKFLRAAFAIEFHQWLFLEAMFQTFKTQRELAAYSLQTYKITGGTQWVFTNFLLRSNFITKHLRTIASEKWLLSRFTKCLLTGFG